MVTFVFSNPRHHLDMMVPVARILRSRGTPCRFVSLAELRGFATPDLADRLPATEVRRVIPPLRRDPSAGRGLGTGGAGGAAALRRIAQRAMWGLALKPRLRYLLRGSEVVVVPNDAAFPYAELARALRAGRVPFALLQEGIRFPLPGEQQVGAIYGRGGASAICVWGDASADHFRKVGVPERAIRVTGNPRFDHVDPAEWRERGRGLMAKLGIDREPLTFLSNTIDDQGFCTTAQKMELFATFLRAAVPVAARHGRAIVVKLHARESVEAFRAAAAAYPGVHVLADEALYAVLAIGHAAVVLASTVGLEALAFGVPLGVLEIPGHGHVFDYVASGAAVALPLADLSHAIEQLVASSPRAFAAPARTLLDRHMAYRGDAAARIADCVAELAHQRTS